MARTGRIERISNTRLGLQLGYRHNEGSLGWCLYGLERPQPTGRIDRGDPLAATKAALREQPGAPLFVYANDEAYRNARGQTDGLTRHEHRVMVERIAAQLAGEGFDVTICLIS